MFFIKKYSLQTFLNKVFLRLSLSLSDTSEVKSSKENGHFNSFVNNGDAYCLGFKNN